MNEGCDNAGELCERTIAGADAEDEFNGNNIASIYGSGSTVHDITLEDFFLMSVSDNNEDDEDGEDAQKPTEASDLSGRTETLSTGNLQDGRPCCALSLHLLLFQSMNGMLNSL